MIPKRPMLPVAMPQAKKVQWASPNGRATQREHQIYPLIMTNGLPWKITIFNRYCKPSISMGHLYHGYVTNNQRVHLYTYMWTNPYYWKHDFRTHQERKKKHCSVWINHGKYVHVCQRSCRKPIPSAIVWAIQVMVTGFVINASKIS